MGKTFIPNFEARPPKPGTFRSIFKWGEPDLFKHPSQGFFSVIKETLELPDSHFAKKRATGDQPVEETVPSNLTREDLAALTKIVGKENIDQSTYARLFHATGKSMEDILRLRHNVIEHLPDIVVHPRSKADVQKIVDHCNSNSIPVHVYGGGSSVTQGLECRKGGVTLVMGTHMNKVIEFNETNQTITVEPGMMGPDYEDALNNAPKRFKAAHAYTGGHFPQSFEHSSVGGWIVTLGAGQASSYYGDAYDLVISQEYVTPTGTFKTRDFPGTATGPKINDIMKGSEGCYGVLVSVTLKVFRHFPKNTRTFGFIFPTWEDAVNASREICQGEFGMPSVLRISDPEETDVAMKMYGIHDSILDRFMKLKSFKPHQRCFLMGQTDGNHRFTAMVKANIKKVCKQNKGMYITGYPMSKWSHGRFSDPYMRDSLNDYDVLIDTLECSVTWENLHSLHTAVRNHIKQNSRTICMTHASHFYAQGTNLYFIFITRNKDLNEFRQFQQGIIEQINANKGSLSHHHGVGRLMASFMENHLGKEQMAVLKALKRHFDPNAIMNPGGTLGLD
ncbi:MAG: FAD-binding oxidoreductase [Desulfobacteraceae bacterium]|nr:FAD-binding oxidoreductase [Desulfobacteraceae bacterium]